MKNISTIHYHELETKILNLLYKQLNLRMKLKLGQLKQVHVFKKIRRDIARIKIQLSKYH